MNAENKLSIMASILGIIGTISAGWMFIELRYAHAIDVSEQFANQQKTIEVGLSSVVLNNQQLMTDYRITEYLAEHQWLVELEKSGTVLNDFQKQRKDYLINTIIRLQKDSIELQKKQLKLKDGEQLTQEVLIEKELDTEKSTDEQVPYVGSSVLPLINITNKELIQSRSKTLSGNEAFKTRSINIPSNYIIAPSIVTKDENLVKQVLPEPVSSQ